MYTLYTLPSTKTKESRAEMGLNSSFGIILVPFFFLFFIDATHVLPPKLFDVRNYGAIADGKTYNTEVSSSTKIIVIFVNAFSIYICRFSCFFSFGNFRHFLRHGKMRVHIMEGVGFISHQEHFCWGL